MSLVAFGEHQSNDTSEKEAPKLGNTEDRKVVHTVRGLQIFKKRRQCEAVKPCVIWPRLQQAVDTGRTFGTLLAANPGEPGQGWR